MIKINYQPGDDILYSHYEGVITLQDILAYLRTITTLTGHLKTVRILEDARDAIADPELTEFEEIFDYIRTVADKREKVVVAAIQDKPVETALSMLFQFNFNVEKYHYRVFSTKEKAEEWLMTF